MKKTLIFILALALLVAVAIIGTIAYLTDMDAATNVMTVGNVDIELLEYERKNVDTKDDSAIVQEFNQNKLLYPAVTKGDFDYSAGDEYVDWEQIGKDGHRSLIWNPDKINNELDKMVFVKNTGDSSVYVRVFYAFEGGAYTSLAQFREKVHLNLNTDDWTWEWEPYIAKKGNEKFFIATATYKHILEPDALTEISLSQISLDPTATNKDVRAFGKEYSVPIFAQAIQTASFSDPKTALVTGFGDTIPFEGVTLDRGIDLNIALHYFEGNKTGTKITEKVASVTFATKDQYPNIVKTGEGTLTLNEYNTPTGKEWGATVHTYYVPNADGNYDLYVLADDGKLYAPKICQNMFANMANLTSVNGTALDVSQTTDMQYMFLNCSKLQKVDVSSWNVGNVTSMFNMFRNCYKVSELDVSKWDMSNAIDVSLMFHSCYELQSIDVGNWKVGKLAVGKDINMGSMFEDCRALTTVNVSGWDTTNVKYIGSMFKGCSNLESIDVSKWNVDNVTEMHSMFAECVKLSSPMNLSGWKVNEVTSMALMFSGCQSLPSIDVSGWNVSNAKSLRGVFKGCKLLTELAVAEWSVSEKNTSLLETFYGCEGLKTLDLSKWDVGGVNDMTRTFAGCSSLASLDVSKWKFSSEATITMEEMFYGCSSLTVLDIADWNVDKVENMNTMFRGCAALTSLNISSWNVSNVSKMGYMFCYCSKLSEIDLSGWNTANVLQAANMFRGCSELQKIYVGDAWKMSQIPEINDDRPNYAKTSINMFLDCSKLVGGKGTTFVSSVTDKTYARVDNPPDAPGYLTHINDKLQTP